MSKIIFNSILISICLCRQIEVDFISDQNWLVGKFWGGIAFNGSIDYGSGFVGSSTLQDIEISDIDIYFSEHEDSISNAWVYSSEDTTSFVGMGIFPGTVYDVSIPNQPRRLNVVFYEENEGDLLWNPESLSDGDREYLLIMDSDYNSDDSVNYINDAFNQDVKYFCWLKKQVGIDWFASEPAKLEFRNRWEINNFNLELGNGDVIINWDFEYPEIELQEIQFYEIFRGDSYNSTLLIDQVSSGINQYFDTNVVLGQEYFYKIVAINYYDEIIIETDILNAIPSYQSFNTNYIDNWNEAHENLLVDYGPKTYNDIWGYTDEIGNEYALIGTWDGTHIINISNDPIMEVGFVEGSYSTHRDIKTYDHYMYVGTEANMPDPHLLNQNQYYIDPQGVQVFDISNPSDPILVNEWDGVVQSHNIMEADGYLYVIGSNDLYSNDGEYFSWGLDDLIILDVETDPSNPTKIGGWSGDYIHDICVSNDILYACAIYANKMLAFDISDKTNPTLITEWGGIPKAHACWVSEDSNFLFTASETSGGYLMSWDVSDLNNITYLDEWLPEGAENYSVHNVFVRDNYLYMSYYIFGLQIIDISDPSNLMLAGFYDTYRQTGDLYTYDGAWGTYPYFNSEKIVISDRQTGLHVVSFEDNYQDSIGDLNNDNIINVLDIIIVVDFILENQNPTDLEFLLSDMNYDSLIDVLDVLIMIQNVIG